MKIKRFRSDSGLEIWVGQDDRSNDELSLRAAHPNDLWFHVSGMPGSHVLLRCGENATMPDRESIRDAASLAAWYSKMRHGGKVAVNYCLAKNVSKPRRVKAGSVNIKQAKKLTVQPRLLEEI